MTSRFDDETRRAELSAPPTERLANRPPRGSADALAWSLDDADTDDLLPYADGEPIDGEPPTESEPGVDSRWWERLPLLAFGAAAAALLAVGGAAVVLTGDSRPPVSQPVSQPSAHASQPPSAPPPAPVVAPPPPVTPTVQQSRPVVTVTRDRPARKTVHPTATATPSATSAPPPPPVVPPTPTPTPTPTSDAPTAPPMTTAYLRIPFVPVPIPINVPANPNQQPQ